MTNTTPINVNDDSQDNETYERKSFTPSSSKANCCFYDATSVGKSPPDDVALIEYNRVFRTVKVNMDKNITDTTALAHKEYYERILEHANERHDANYQWDTGPKRPLIVKYPGTFFFPS